MKLYHSAPSPSLRLPQLHTLERSGRSGIEDEEASLREGPYSNSTPKELLMEGAISLVSNSDERRTQEGRQALHGNAANLNSARLKRGVPKEAWDTTFPFACSKYDIRHFPCSHEVRDKSSSLFLIRKFLKEGVHRVA